MFVNRLDAKCCCSDDLEAAKCRDRKSLNFLFTQRVWHYELLSDVWLPRLRHRSAWRSIIIATILNEEEGKERGIEGVVLFHNCTYNVPMCGSFRMFLETKKPLPIHIERSFVTCACLSHYHTHTRTQF